MPRNTVALEQGTNTPDRSLGGVPRRGKFFVAEYEPVLVAMENDVGERPANVDRERE
jgi:hypothetical protein